MSITSRKGGYDVPSYPALFMRATTSMIPAGAPMVRPSCSEQLDYEAELMVIIGKGGKHIGEEDALSMSSATRCSMTARCANTSARPISGRPARISTPPARSARSSSRRTNCRKARRPQDRVPRRAPRSCRAQRTSDMLWSVARTIATISEFTTLEPGDMIAMGTPPGCRPCQDAAALAASRRDGRGGDRGHRHLRQSGCRRRGCPGNGGRGMSRARPRPRPEKRWPSCARSAGGGHAICARASAALDDDAST